MEVDRRAWNLTFGGVGGGPSSFQKDHVQRTFHLPAENLKVGGYPLAIKIKHRFLTNQFRPPGGLEHTFLRHPARLLQRWHLRVGQRKEAAAPGPQVVLPQQKHLRGSTRTPKRAGPGTGGNLSRMAFNRSLQNRAARELRSAKSEIWLNGHPTKPTNN